MGTSSRRIARTFCRRTCAVGLRAAVRGDGRRRHQAKRRCAGRGAGEVPTKLNQDGYLSAYPTNFYDRLKEGKRVWAPFYTYHKILAGHFGYVHALRKRAGSMRTTTTGAMASVRSKRGRSASTFIGAVTRKTEVLGRTNSLACAG